ncbi:diguanylate cyclase domain-containing protein [Malonomonas rubra]|uniref:diguanylate cyclase domain-containing protein n=1 Tax=Malonomonas rubra TaxID=57040 RepID=UPI001114BC40|nr:diguanylate cyclase [Malonomonas rubra]
MHRILLFLIMLLLPLGTASAAVRVGIDSNPPLTFIDANGQAGGLFPDLLQQIAKQHNWKLEIQPCQWNSCLEMLEDGRIDVLPAIAYTEQRALKYNFAEETVFTSWGQVYRRSTDNSQIDSILQLNGKKLAVLAGDVYYISEQGLRQVADKFGVAIDYVEVTSYRDAFIKLAAGEVDAAMVGRLFGIKHRQEYGVQPAPILIKPIQVRPAFAKTAPPQLKQQFDSSLADWKSSTTSIYYQLLEKWLGEKLATQMPQWLSGLMYGLSALLLLLLLSTLWTRRLVKQKTRLLKQKNRQLEDELNERQQIETELRERQQQYQVLFEENQVVMLLIDPETRLIVDGNPAACEFYGYPRETLQGMNIGEINQLSPEEIKQKTLQIKSGDLQQFEIPHRKANGDICPVEILSSPIVVEGRSLIYSIIRDISKRKAAEKALADRNDFLQSVIDGVSDPLMVINFDHQVLQFNQAAARQVSPELLAQDKISCHEISHASKLPCSGDAHPCPLQEVKETGQPVSTIHNHLDENQQIRIIEVLSSPLYNSDGELYAAIEVTRDITERQKIEELLSENEKRLHHLAHHDALTNLPNRLLFEDRMKQALSKAKRSRKQVALFFIDLDHFKEINDNFGHDHGDLVLIDVAQRLANTVRESDTVARLGGDEFLVLLEDIDNVQLVEVMAERICEALTHEMERDTYRQKLSASIGISIFPEDGSTGHELLKTADKAMYQAKGKGRANYQFASTPQAHFDF